MDDSGQALDLPPNRGGFRYRCDFGGQEHLAFDINSRKERPFRPGVRSESELPAWLLMVSAPLPRQSKSSAERSWQQ
jgi:hypothetical protein